MIKITLLGTAASVPTPSRGMPAIAAQFEGGIVLFDCGEGTQRQMMRFKASYSKVRSIYLSHLHLDHYLGVFGLIETLRMNKHETPINLFGPPGVSRIFSNRPLLQAFELPKIRKKTLIEEFGNYQAFAFPVSHGPGINAYGFSLEKKPYLRFHEKKAKAAGIKGQMFSQLQKQGKLKVGKKTLKLKDFTYLQSGKKIVYSGDTQPCAPLTTASKGADLLIHECTFPNSMQSEAREKYHSTPADASLTARKANAKLLLLTHFSGRISDTDEIIKQAKKGFTGKVMAATDGLTLQI